MTLSVADIAASAFNSVVLKLSGVIKDATLTRVTQGEYDATTGAYAVTSATDTGRVVFDFAATQQAFSNIFPAYTPGRNDKMAYFEGLTTLEPVENDTITIGAEEYTVLASVDVAEGGGLYAVAVR